MTQSLCLEINRGLRLVLGAVRLDGGQVIEVLTKHRRNKANPRQLRHRIGTDQTSISENRDGIADLIDLFQEMRDKDDADALLLQRAHHRKQLLNLLVIERGGRLIQDQHLRVHIHRTGDGHHLLQRDRIVLQLPAHINRKIQTLHQLLRPLVHRAAVDCMELCHRLPPDKQILRDRQIRAQVDLLVHG